MSAEDVLPALGRRGKLMWAPYSQERTLLPNRATRSLENPLRSADPPRPPVAEAPPAEPFPAEPFPLVYDELREVAHRQLEREADGHTLNTTALVHEVYLRL